MEYTKNETLRLRRLMRALSMRSMAAGIPTVCGGVHLEPEALSKLEKSTAFPCTVMLAATWNDPLGEEYGLALGEDPQLLCFRQGARPGKHLPEASSKTLTSQMKWLIGEAE